MTTLSWRMRRRSADAVPKLVVWETPVSGDKMAPFDHPELNLDRVWFSSTFDYYKVAHHGTHSLTHAAVAGKSTNFGIAFTVQGQTVATDQVLYTHGLGYVPRFMLAVGGKLIQDFHPIQIVGTDRVRCVSFYATSTAIHCIDFGSASASTLPAITASYDLLLFRPPLDGVDPSLPVFSGKRGILGSGLVMASDILLRRADSDDASPFDLNLGPAVDIYNGCVRWFLSDGSIVSFGPYGGSAGAPPTIQCVVTE